MSIRPSPEVTLSSRVEPWRIELLGGIRARRGGTVVDEFRTRRAAVLLARLALNPRAHRRDELIAMLWPGAPMAAGRQNLSQSLSELRRRLEPPHESEVVFATRELVWLDREHITTDVAEFEGALAEAHRRSGHARIPHLERAVGIAEAPLLPGVDHEWAIASRERVSAECDAALHELVQHHEAQGDFPAAFEFAWRRVRIDPLDESAHREFARLYERMGRPAAGLHHLREFLAELARERGEGPEPETRALAEALAARLAALASEHGTGK